MRGPEVGVDAKAWGRGIGRGAGALAQAVSSNSSELQVSKRIDTSLRPAWCRGSGLLSVEVCQHSPARWESCVGRPLPEAAKGRPRLDVVGTIPSIEGGYWGACPGDKQDENASDCYSYTSEWKFVPDPEHSLPELVVTTRGTPLDKDINKELEPFHEVRVFSFRSGEYTQTSRQDVPPGEGTE
jgi:hypothetical protein